LAVSTGTWNITSGGSTAMAELNPMTFYTSISLTNGIWASTKTIYDPCPAGWRVPEGGDNGVWAKALGKTKDVNVPNDYTNRGINYTGAFGADETIWYPCSGFRNYSDGGLVLVDGRGYNWSCSPYESNGYFAYSYHLYFDCYSDVNPSSHSYRADGYPVRCLQE
jgi:uncharacterized protein (TIGR02145 family)